MFTELARTKAEPLVKQPEWKLIKQHAKVGLGTIGFGVALFGALVAAHTYKFPVFTEWVWGALLSVPVTILTSGLFSVFYELYMRNTFLKAMRGLNRSWDSGVTVYPTHREAPDRKEVLATANKRIRLLSTTLFQYCGYVGEELKIKAQQGVHFEIIIYNPSSRALEEKAREENQELEGFKDEIRSTCRRHLGPLVKEFPGQVKLKFCDFNAPFGITIVDDKHLVLSLNIFGLARSKNQTPCLIIDNRYDPESVFKLYENSFDAIWTRLPDAVPTELQPYFVQQPIA